MKLLLQMRDTARPGNGRMAGLRLSVAGTALQLSQDEFTHIDRAARKG